MRKLAVVGALILMAGLMALMGRFASAERGAPRELTPTEAARSYAAEQEELRSQKAIEALERAFAPTRSPSL
jgi:hypothetical protein